MRRTPLPIGAAAAVRTAPRRLAATLGGAGLLQFALLGASLSLPAAPAQAQQIIYSNCRMSNTAANATLTAGTTETVWFTTLRFDCSSYDGGVQPPVNRLCVEFLGGGERYLRYPSGARFPYRLRYDPVGDLPIEDGKYYALSAQPRQDHPYHSLTLRAVVPVPASASGHPSDTISLSAFLAPLAGSSGCPNISQAISPVTPATLTLDLDIISSCFIAASNLVNFTVAINGDKTAESRATGNITVNCPTDTAYTVYLGKGEGATATPLDRSMQQNGGAGKLWYRLLKPNGDTWTEGGAPSVNGFGGVSGRGTGLNETYAVTGVLRAGQTLPPAGAYSDRVQITLVY